MNKIILYTFLGLLSLSFINRDNDPWKPSQLSKPEDLSKILNDHDKTNDPLILNIGPAGAILSSVHIGPVDEAKGLKILEEKIKSVPKDKAIVIYCGCCPFGHCPNIRPAFTLLTKKGFKNHTLLNLPKNIKADWIDKGFPMAD
jgi:thiosulfate/3-mercaptopyruvate sulfurtransferase